MANVTRDGEIILSLDHMDTIDKQRQGLQHMTSLPENEGLLFPTRGGSGYHSRNCKIQVDIAYCGGGKILKIDTVVPELGTSIAPSGASWAIETNAGWFQSNGFIVGDSINIKL